MGSIESVFDFNLKLLFSFFLFFFFISSELGKNMNVCSLTLDKSTPPPTSFQMSWLFLWLWHGKCMLTYVCKAHGILQVITLFAQFISISLCHARYKGAPHHEKTCFMPYANNKDADQPAHSRSLISAFVVRCLDSIILPFSISEISSLELFYVAEQAGLSLTW